MDEERSGVTFGEIFRTIWSQKWLALIVLLVITLAGTLGLKYGYSSLKTEYVSTFSVNINLGEDGMLEYPDNTRHNFRDMISLENLNSIKEANEDFASVNVDAMRKNGDISISQNKGDSGVTYKVRVKADYFRSADVASAFIHEIACTGSREIYKWVRGLAADTGVSFNEKLGNEQKLEFLKSQLIAIEARFKNLGGISDAAKQKVSNLLLTATALAGELHTAYYEPSAEALDNYVNLIKGLESELELAKSVLNNLKGLNVNAPDSGTTVILNSAEIVRYAEMVAKLEQQIDVYKQYHAPTGAEEIAASNAFTVKLEKLLADVQALTAVDECHYYKNTSLVSYEGAPVVQEGDFGFIKSGLLSLVVGLIVALLAAYIVGYIVNNRKKASVNDDKADVASGGEIPSAVQENGASESTENVEEKK